MGFPHRAGLPHHGRIGRANRRDEEKERDQHMIGNGDTASQVFFGAFLVTALAGMPPIDAKLARRDPATWEALSAVTSVVPFVAILAGRNRFVPREIVWWVPVVAVIAWVALLSLHARLFGVSPVPF